MICPKDGHRCGCENHVAGHCSPPPKPSLAEIERLVDAMVMAFEDMHTFGGQHYMTKYKDARAALMAAVKLYGEG